MNHTGSDEDFVGALVDIAEFEGLDGNLEHIEKEIEGDELEDEILALLGEAELENESHKDDLALFLEGDELEEEVEEVRQDDVFVDVEEPAPPPLDRYQLMARRAGLEERDRSDALYAIASPASARPVGRMQIMHGASLNIVAICGCGHDAASSKGRAGQCRLLIHAMTGFMDKYEAALLWLAAGPDHNTESHKAAGEIVKDIWRNARPAAGT